MSSQKLQVVLQCLYSQCPTVHFGAALHHSLSACYEYEVNGKEAGAVPAILRHQALRRRTNDDKDKDKTSSSSSFTISARATQSATVSRFRRFESAPYTHSKPTMSVSNYVRSSSATATTSAIATDKPSKGGDKDGYKDGKDGDKDTY